MFLQRALVDEKSSEYLTSEGYVHDDGRLHLLGLNYSHCPVVDTYNKRMSKLMQRDEVIQVWVRDCSRR